MALMSLLHIQITCRDMKVLRLAAMDITGKEIPVILLTSARPLKLHKNGGTALIHPFLVEENASKTQIILTGTTTSLIYYTLPLTIAAPTIMM
jgi:hypothetical protein